MSAAVYCNAEFPCARVCAKLSDESLPEGTDTGFITDAGSRRAMRVRNAQRDQDTARRNIESSELAHGVPGNEGN